MASSGPTRVELFTREEALLAFDYCRRNLRVQWNYLNDERERYPLASHEYSEWKLRDARNDLRKAIRVLRAFRKPHLKLVGEN